MTLLIGRYHIRSYSTTGRATKGYFAYVLGQSRLVFLKVTWRPDSPHIDTEVDRYIELHTAKVPNIPHLLTGYDTRHDPIITPNAVDVDGNGPLLRTQNHSFYKTENLLPRIQTRLVYETLGLRLDEYQASWVLVKVVFDALRGTQFYFLSAA